MNQTEKEKFIATVLAKIASCYQHFQVNQHSIEMWLAGLRGCKKEEVWKALEKHVRISKFPPTIAELLEIVFQNRTNERDHQIAVQKRITYKEVNEIMKELKNDNN